MIDEGLEDDWPPEVIEAAKKFQQGHLLEKPPIGYAADLRYSVWALTKLEAAAAAEENVDDPQAESDAGPVHLALHEDDCPPYGIITSQTCDVAEDRPVPVQPWFEVSPVYLCDEQSALLNRDYIYPLNDFSASGGKRWVADLRLTASLEKSMLVGREPIMPFAAEKAQIAFGLELGRRKERAALAESVHDIIEQTLHDHKPRKLGERIGKQRIYKLLLRISEGTRLEPRDVQLHVLCQAEPENGVSDEELHDWFGKWYDEARVVAERQEIILIETRFHDCANMDVTLYDELIEIRTPI